MKKKSLDGIEYEVNLFGDIFAKNDADYIKLAQKDINKIKYFPSEKFTAEFALKLMYVLTDYVNKKLRTSTQVDDELKQKIEEIRAVINSKREEYQMIEEGKAE